MEVQEPMLMRFDPFREIDRAFDEVWNRPPAIPMDAVRRDNVAVVHFDLPGVDQSSIELTVERNVLTLRAERHFETVEGEEVLARERRHGTFTRQLFLGDTLDANRIEANYENGVLTVSIPVAESAKPRKVAIEGTQPGPQKAINVEATESVAS